MHLSKKAEAAMPRALLCCESEWLSTPARSWFLLKAPAAPPKGICEGGHAWRRLGRGPSLGRAALEKYQRAYSAIMDEINRRQRRYGARPTIISALSCCAHILSWRQRLELIWCVIVLIVTSYIGNLPIKEEHYKLILINYGHQARWYTLGLWMK